MNVAMLLDIPAMINPDAPALLGANRTGYADLRARTALVAGLLADLGVKPGDRVGVFATNSEQYVEVLFGIAARGAVGVPMNFRARQAEIAHLLGDSGCPVLFTESRYADLVESMRPAALTTVVHLDGDYRQRRDTAVPDDSIADVDDADLALLLYTSGTTSLPKGVTLTHGALTGYVMGTTEAADGGPAGRMLLGAPLYHIAGITSSLKSLYAGRAIALLPQFEAAAWLDAVEQHRITNTFVVPTMLARIVAAPDLADRDLSSLQLVTYGAAPMPPSVIGRALEVFPRTVGFSGAYGQTETTSTVTVLDTEDHRIDPGAADAAAKLRRLSSVGRAVDDVEIRIIDDAGGTLAPGEVGEVALRTPRATRGYWASEPGSARTSIDADGWLHTGDRGYLDKDGYLFLGGRTGDLIIRGGENVAPEEVEAVLYEHDDVLEAAVVGVPDEEWGERIVAAVVRRTGSALTEEALVDFCRPRLAGFKRPEGVVFTEALPRTSTGKLIRRDLPTLLTGP